MVLQNNKKGDICIMRKGIIFFVFLMFMLLVVGGLIFLSLGNSRDEAGAGSTNINEKYGIKKLQINKIEIKFFSDKSFQDLEEKVGAINDKEPETGKINPFKKN